MTSVLRWLVFSLWLALAALSPLHAQEPADDRGGDSSEVEESDEEYRRRMELEDARQRDLGYTLPAPTYAQKQEKLDKLPEESRDHIRDQLVDIIMEDGEWEPSDALKEYPYEPTAAAMGDPELMQQEQEAWDEQIEKYHKREAAAYGTYLGPVPGPGNPSGEQAGGEAGEGAEGSEQGSGQEGGAESDTAGDSRAGAQQQAASAAAATAGSYAPYQPNRSDSEEEVSTAGAQQSALEFLKAMQGRASASPAAPTAGAAATAVAEAGDEAAAAGAQPDPAEQAAEATDPQEPDSASEAAQSESSDKTVEIDLTTPGLILIEDLEKLEGTGGPDDTEQPD